MKRHDSGWRDARLPLVHAGWNVTMPAPGMSLVMLEYDRGEAIAVINYIRRDVPTPWGEDVGRSFHAMSNLRSPIGTLLPFLTVRYDPRSWSMQLFPHNDPARDLIAADGWLTVTEEHFVRLLYRLRGRSIPPTMGRYGVNLSTAPWPTVEGRFQPQGWDGHEISIRRRDYEPEGPGVRFKMRNPCADFDLAVIGSRSASVKLVVDFKLKGTDIDPGHHTHRAMSDIRNIDGNPIPSMLVQYEPANARWKFDVLCLNQAARSLLEEFLKRTRAVADAWTADDWTYVDEDRWSDLLEELQQG